MRMSKGESQVESLLNAEVIKAAATSPLGTLSLMSLILGILAMGFFRDAPVRAKVVVFALLLLGVAGFGYSIVNQGSPEKPPEASRDFVVGRWQVEQKALGMEGGTYIDYLEDGRFSGRQELFQNGQGSRVNVSGSWDFTELSRDQFRLELAFDTGEHWRGTFRILGRDRIHNNDENYLAVRVPH
jgi:hypothetical protein